MARLDLTFRLSSCQLELTSNNQDLIWSVFGLISLIWLDFVCFGQDDFIAPIPLEAPKAKAAGPGSIEDPRGVGRDRRVAVSKHKAKAKLPPPTKASSSAASSSAAKARAPPPKPKFAPPSPPSPIDFGEPVAPAPIASVPAGPPRRAKKEKPVIPAIGGRGSVVYENYTAPTMMASYGNWQFNCINCPKADGCQRTMGRGPRNTRRHGDLEPLGFLHVWHDTPPRPDKSHRKTNPRDEDVDSFIANHGDELRALANAFYTEP